MRHINFILVLLFIPVVYVLEFIINTFHNGIPDAYDSGKSTIFILKRAFYFYINKSRFLKDNEKWEKANSDNKYLSDKDSTNRYIAFFSKGTQLISLTRKRKVMHPYYI